MAPSAPQKVPLLLCVCGLVCSDGVIEISHFRLYYLRPDSKKELIFYPEGYDVGGNNVDHGRMANRSLAYMSKRRTLV